MCITTTTDRTAEPADNHQPPRSNTASPTFRPHTASCAADRIDSAGHEVAVLPRQSGVIIRRLLPPMPSALAGVSDDRAQVQMSCTANKAFLQ